MTDPKVLAEQLLQKNWSKFGTFRRPCTYNQMNSASYVPATGVATGEVISIQEGVEIIFDSPGQFFKTFENDQPVQSTDKVAIFPSLDLNVTPTVQDQIIDPEGIVWIVKAIGDDPGPAHYELLIRPREVQP